ncbi:MAG: hypothetical protein E5X68_23280 [Mesorhizobium sp.]|nr:MAG: hypothetical protein EOQ84_24150 [Mesorhizobium sp.]RWL24415.1 MAG: hypothetical protein EOR58_23200 [Mesorhizobium sp.]RWL26336.1 MAG: hypothetical protein EOR63_25050 [Mesorhizobium sp.]RWL35571.1 MAG: hypothetical protein EOR59_22370 [Mesorhizobium sp.]RWL48200.1 MAG: hypothetical protein EOR62_27370 [Mesorhizobium sp.]
MRFSPRRTWAQTRSTYQPRWISSPASCLPPSVNGSRPNDDIEKVTGRPATSFQDFARRNAAAWAPEAIG